MKISNALLCQKANNVKLDLYKFGYAIVKSEWNGFVKNPFLSRLYYVIDGKAYIEYNKMTLTLLPGNWYLLPAGLSFNYRCDDKMESLYFHITISGKDETDLLNVFSTPISFADNSNPALFYMQYIEDNSLFAALTVKQSLYLNILKFIKISDISPEITEFSPCVQKAVGFINNNLHIKLNLTTVSEHAFVSKSTLTKKFKNELNITVQEYILNQKMFRAEQMLKNGNVSVAEISERLGFSEQFYFSRCFKQKFGISPREYRKSN